MENKTVGIGFSGILTIVFIVLKLCNVITWSWWWVLSPLWITAAVVIACFLVSVILTMIVVVRERNNGSKQ